MQAAQQDTVETAYLVVQGDDGFGDTFRLTPGQTFTLGRAASNCIVLKDDLCSREHADIAYVGGRWRIRDLNSANGTRVNGEPLNDGERDLAPGDSVGLGRMLCLFTDDLNRLPARPPPDDDDQHLPTGVEALRAEFQHWLYRHGGILRVPAAHSTAVVPTPDGLQIPETQWFGAMGKCCYFVDALIGACLKTLLPITGERGTAMVEKIAGGKSLDRLTLGEQTQILGALDAHTSRAFWDSVPHTQDREGTRLLGRSGVAMLHKLSRMRNDFAHGRWLRDQAEKEQFAQEFPKAVAELCESMLVIAARVLEELAQQGNTQMDPGQGPPRATMPP